MNVPGIHVAGPSRLHDQVVTHLFSHRLDEELADGASPDRDRTLTLRAQQLSDLGTRRKLARAIQHAISEAGEDHSRVRSGRIWPLADRTSEACPELELLAEKLAEPGPVGVRGVAEARVLLTDCASPLYDSGSKESVRDWAACATMHLTWLAH